MSDKETKGKRYHWYRDGMWCDDDPLPGDPLATTGKWRRTEDFDALATEKAGLEANYAIAREAANHAGDAVRARVRAEADRDRLLAESQHVRDALRVMERDYKHRLTETQTDRDRLRAALEDARSIAEDVRGYGEHPEQFADIRRVCDAALSPDNTKGEQT
jgi:hypothetical protein